MNPTFKIILIISYISIILLGCNKNNDEFVSKPVKMHYIDSRNIEHGVTTEEEQELFDEV